MLDSLPGTRSPRTAPRVHGLDSQSPRPTPADQRTRHSSSLLVVENVADSANVVRQFTECGWRSTATSDLARARWLASVRTFGLVVVVGPSLTWCTNALRLLRPLTACPILALSNGSRESQPQLLRSGADLVFEQGCPIDLLRSASEALVRRTTARKPALRFLESCGLRVDVWARHVVLDGVEIKLTPTEFEVLRLLMTHAQIAVKHHDIIRQVWNWKYADERNALRLQINRLRSKLTDASGRPRFIRSVRGLGYVFDKPVTEFADGDDAISNAPGGESFALLEARLRGLIETLMRSDNRAQACAALVKAVVYDGMCDGAAVFARRPNEAVLTLVAQSGMPPEWQASVADGLPLDGPYVAADTFNTCEIRNFVDVCKLGRVYSRSVRLLRAAELPVQLSVPLVDRYTTWGQVGFARHSDSPFTPLQCMVLEAAGTVLGSLFAKEP